MSKNAAQGFMMTAVVVRWADSLRNCRLSGMNKMSTRITLVLCLTLLDCSNDPQDPQAATAAKTPAAVESVAQMEPHNRDTALRFVQAIPLPGVEGRFDHMAVDLQRQRLFVAALGNNSLEIMNLQNGERLQTIKSFQKPTGIAFAPKLNRIFAASGDGERCEILDSKTFRIVHSTTSLPDADNVRFDDAEERVYVGYGDGALAKIDAGSGRKMGDIPLKGHPESFQLEKTGARIFVNVPTAESIAVIDRAQNKVVATWTLEGARSNFPMALDESNHRLFVGCREPASLLVYDTASGRVAASLPIAADTDDLFYDAARRRLYVACGGGFINVIQQQDADVYKEIARIPTAEGARTALFVPELRRFYLAVPQRGSQRAEIRVFEVQP